MTRQQLGTGRRGRVSVFRPPHSEHCPVCYPPPELRDWLAAVIAVGVVVGFLAAMWILGIGL